MRSYRHNTRSICAKMMAPVANAKIGGTRYVCSLRDNHEGPCGGWRFVTQPTHARLAREHRTDCGGVTSTGAQTIESSDAFCSRCKLRFPLSEFTWEPDGEPLDPILRAVWIEEVAERQRLAAEESERNRLQEISELEARLARLKSRAPT